MFIAPASFYSSVIDRTVWAEMLEVNHQLGSFRYLGFQLLILRWSQSPAAVSSAEMVKELAMTSVLTEDKLRSLLWGIGTHKDSQGHVLASLCKMQTCGWKGDSDGLLMPEP